MSSGDAEIVRNGNSETQKFPYAYLVVLFGGNFTFADLLFQSLQVLACVTQGEKILHDFIWCLGLIQEELAQAKSQLARAEQGSHSKAEFTSLCEQLQETHVELRASKASVIGPSQQWRRWLEN